MTVGRLVDVLNVGCIPADEPLSEVNKSALYGFRVAFEGRFTPSNDTLEALG